MLLARKSAQFARIPNAQYAAALGLETIACSMWKVIVPHHAECTKASMALVDPKRSAASPDASWCQMAFIPVPLAEGERSAL